MGSLDGKRVIITGAAGGIGAAAVEAFVKEGAKVACSYNSAAPDLPAGVVASAKCDITSKASVDSVFDGFAEKLGGLDVLIQAAGLHGGCPADQLTEEYWDNVFALNGKATLFTNQAAFRHMREHGGSIVNMSSVSGLVGGHNLAAYNASKGGVRLLSKSVALYGARLKPPVRCNSVHPSFIEGPLVDGLMSQVRDPVTARDRMTAMVPLGRFGTPAEVAELHGLRESPKRQHLR